VALPVAVFVVAVADRVLAGNQADEAPALDLDNVYGRGPNDQPYMYDGGNAFLLGDALQGGDPRAKDLPRNTANPRRALIGDPRNDENTIVSQLQGLFLRFHSRTLDENPGLELAEIQRLVRYHYQYVVLNDSCPGSSTRAS